MRRGVLVFFVSLVLLGAPWGGLLAQQEPEEILKELEEIAVIDQKIMVQMRDGVRLATDVYRPKTDKPVPIIFSKTPYNFNIWRDGELSGRTLRRALEVVKRGYAYVVQNERGKFFSEGKWDILGPPRTDGYDALSWMSEQPWSNGLVGTFGCSSTAEWQMGVASLGHPALAAMVPQGFGAGVGRVGGFYEQGNWYRGGAVQMLFIAWLYGNQNIQRPNFPEYFTQEDLVRVSRFYDLAPEMPRVDWSQGLAHLPVQDIMRNVDGPRGIFAGMIKRKPNDPAWYQGGLYHDDMPLEVPGLWFMSWYDVSTGPNLALFNHVRNNAQDPAVRRNQYAVIAPSLHCRYRLAGPDKVVGERYMGDTSFDYEGLVYGWFDYWLKQEKNGVLERTPRVQYFTMGTNKWQSSDTWPPQDAQMVTFYLHSGGNANSLHGDGRLSHQAPDDDQSPDAFTYDPANPVPSYGGNVCCTGNAVEGGSFDQQRMETRNDILVYSTEPLNEGVEVTGTIEIDLYVESDAPDTDFTVKLIDVYPDGRAYNLDETIQRVRYREGYDQEVFMRPGEVYKVAVSPMSTSNYFAPGHRIRIEVSSSNFPRFDRNLNTGGNNYDEAQGRVARNKVRHSAQHPSQIRLPIIKPVPGNAGSE
ncbi:MAG TPA: CocE/NonD family hydrolase [Acidobacteriota bacterium]|nr:CocE/NonD family hydrolase [Acidobacteriota bacterium]